MDFMESLLCPQISMDVDDTPLELSNSDHQSTGEVVNPDSEEHDANHISDDEKVKMLLELENFDPAQTPESLTEDEKELKSNLFKLGPAVQFMKIHCTACYSHLGSAPINQFDRYIHPLLNVLLCKFCYEFYCSGEFEKDEDGSEMYCRWCGQGGKVMCCSDCAYVFCQKCVRQNLGKKTLDLIKDSDDWRCFACNPPQLMNLKLICESLYQYIKDTIRLSKETNDVELLKKDETICCTKPNRPPPLKRKRVSVRNDDETYNPAMDILEAKRAKSKFIVQKPASPVVLPDAATTSWQSEVVCTPDLPMLMNEAPDNQDAVKLTNMPQLSKYLRVKVLPKENDVRRPIVIAPKLTPKPPVMICSPTNQPLTANVVTNRGRPVKGSQNFIPQPIPQRNMITNTSKNSIVNTVPAKLAAGLKHNWFDKAQQITNSITNNLTRRLAGLTIEQKNARSIEQLANIHNRLQELLSSSVNSLIQVRKNLRAEFLNDLNKLKFADSKQKITTFPLTINQNASTSNTETNNVDDDDDDDVIIINEDPLADANPPPLVEIGTNTPTTGFIKVKSVAALQGQAIKSNGVTEEIDLCDDDDDYMPIPPAIIMNDEEDVDDPDAVMNPDAPKPETDEKVEEVIKPAEEVKPEEEAAIPDEMDKETYLQIQRALAESKFESIMEANSKVRVDDSIAPVELKRILSVRVCLDTKKQKAEKRKAAPASMVVQDFEEMLSHSTIVVNKKKTKKTKLDDSPFSKFLSTNQPGEDKLDAGGDKMEEEKDKSDEECADRNGDDKMSENDKVGRKSVDDWDEEIDGPRTIDETTNRKSIDDNSEDEVAKNSDNNESSRKSIEDDNSDEIPKDNNDSSRKSIEDDNSDEIPKDNNDSSRKSDNSDEILKDNDDSSRKSIEDDNSDEIRKDNDESPRKSTEDDNSNDMETPKSDRVSSPVTRKLMQKPEELSASSDEEDDSAESRQILKALAAVGDGEDSEEEMHNEEPKSGNSDVEEEEEEEDEKIEEERSENEESVKKLNKSDITTDHVTTTDSGIDMDGK